MSFGFGVSDFLTVGQLCWKVYKKCKDSPGNYAELSSEVGVLHNVMKETEELLSQQDLTTEQGVKLNTCRQGCEGVVKDLDGLLVKYESLGSKSQRAFDRMRFGMKDMNGIRLRLISNVTMLDGFNNAWVQSALTLPISSFPKILQILARKIRKQIEPTHRRNPCWETRRLCCINQNIRRRCSE